MKGLTGRMERERVKKKVRKITKRKFPFHCLFLRSFTLDKQSHKMKTYTKTNAHAEHSVDGICTTIQHTVLVICIN